MKELALNAESAGKQELDSLKQSFYKFHNAELEAAKKQFIDSFRPLQRLIRMKPV